MAPTSWIWEHYTKDSANVKASCNLCNKTFSLKGGNGSLIYHLKNRHLLSEKNNQNNIVSISKDSHGRNIPSKKANEVLSRLSAENIEQFYASSSHRTCNAARAQVLTGLVVDVVIKDLDTLNFCEKEGMRQLLQFMEPGYQFPTSNTIKQHINLRYGTERIKLKTKIKDHEIKYISITIDLWTNRQTVSFATITGHYLHDWRMVYVNLGTFEASIEHNGLEIGRVIDHIVSDYGLTVFCCVHDHASNMLSAVRISDVVKYSIGCFAHLLNLGTRDCLTLFSETVSVSEDEDVIKKVKTIITKTRKSEKVKQEFDRQKKTMLPQKDWDKELQQENDTRWDSLYTSLNSYIVLHPAAEATMRKLCTIADLPKHVFSPVEFIQLEGIVAVLSGVKELTTIWQGQNYVTISSTYPTLFAVVAGLRGLNDTPVPALRDLLITHLEERFCIDDDDFLGTGCIHMLASALDPRFKSLEFVSNDIKNIVHEPILDELQTYLRDVNPVEVP